MIRRIRLIRKWRFICTALALVWGLAGGTVRADLHFPEPRADAGEVRTGIPVTHQFSFTNDGPEAVEILAAQPSCGCLIPRVDKRTYQPGERGSLRLEVNTLTQTAGPQTWRVQVRYRRGEEVREVPLELNARVVAEVTVRPAALIVVADCAVRHDIVFTDKRARPLTLTALQSTSPKLTARLGEAHRDADGHPTRTIHLEVLEDFPEGRHEEILHIHTNDPVYRDLKVPVTVIKRLRQRVAALPNQVTLTAAPGTPLPSQLIRLRDQQNETVTVESIITDDPALTCSWAPGPGPAATLKIRVDHKRLPADRWQSAVHVHISRPVRDILTIPVEVIGH